MKKIELRILIGLAILVSILSCSKSADDYIKSGDEKTKNNNFIEAISDYNEAIKLKMK